MCCGQVIGRDRIADVVNSISVLGAVIERICTQIRIWHSFDEVCEGFGDKQVGSSSMPHKKNPIKCEQLCGLARILRGHSLSIMENISLWGQRDMTHSSVERVLLPQIFNIIAYMITTFMDIVTNLHIDVKTIELHTFQDPAFRNTEREMMDLTAQDNISRTQALQLAKRTTQVIKHEELLESINEVLKQRI
jgi:adenylosuccinate lyase